MIIYNVSWLVMGRFSVYKMFDLMFINTPTGLRYSFLLKCSVLRYVPEVRVPLLGVKITVIKNKFYILLIFFSYIVDLEL